jgi:hypothetical protein
VKQREYEFDAPITIALGQRAYLVADANLLGNMPVWPTPTSGRIAMVVSIYLDPVAPDRQYGLNGAARNRRSLSEAGCVHLLRSHTMTPPVAKKLDL